MTATGRLTRAFYPRWMTKPIETSTSSPVDTAADRGLVFSLISPTISRQDGSLSRQEESVSRQNGSLSRRDESLSREDESLPITSTQTVSKLRTLLKTSVVNVGKHMLTSQTARYARSCKEDGHSIVPGQAFAEAMSECHTSVSQYYGLTATKHTESVPHNLPVSMKPDRKSATIASKKARIIEAKHNRLSMADTERKVKSLTLNALAPGISIVSRATRLKELCEHVRINPSARLIAVNHGVIPFLLSLQADDRKSGGRRLADTKRLSGIINETLAVLGHSQRIHSKGIKILSIDGGGTRGLVSIETLKQLEILCRAPIHTMFDYICGVSTGGLLAVLLGPMKLPLDRCEQVYKECSQKIFNQSTIAGTANLLTKHCYYDMSVWETILRDEIGADRTMLSTSKEDKCPRIGLVSTVMADVPYNYVFRNYNHNLSSTSQYPGSCDVRVWEAIRASSAAPGYFEDFKIGRHIHQDGGVLNNNPTAIALHEAKALWPEEKVQCVVSVGNGRYEPGTADNVQDITSLRHKLGTFIHSATNTEDVHTVLNDLLAADSYFRFNPYMSEEFMLNEIEEAKLQQMQFDTQQYLRRNASKLNMAGQQLRAPRTSQQKMQDWIKDKYLILTNQMAARS